MPIFFNIERLGNDFFSTADDGPKFFVGRRVPYKENIGLYNIFAGTRLEKLNYEAGKFNHSLGFWADFIEPTAICEGRNFLTLNTYDRASFTFGFGQFAAHVPDGDFIKYFQALLTHSVASEYFPNLTLKNKRIHMIENSGNLTQLEDATSTSKLLKYLNPTLDEVEDNEVIASSKFIHWTSSEPSARQVQVDQMVATFKRFMHRSEARIDMKNRPAAHCCVIADILHQGRGGKMTWPLIDAAVKSSKPFDSLIAIGSPEWESRKVKLKKTIESNPAFAGKVWNVEQHDFSD